MTVGASVPTDRICTSCSKWFTDNTGGHLECISCQYLHPHVAGVPPKPKRIPMGVGWRGMTDYTCSVCGEIEQGTQYSVGTLEGPVLAQRHLILKGGRCVCLSCLAVAYLERGL